MYSLLNVEYLIIFGHDVVQSLSDITHYGVCSLILIYPRSNQNVDVCCMTRTHNTHALTFNKVNMT